MSGFSRPREFTKPVGLKKIHSGFGFGVRIHWFHVDKRSVRIKKVCGFKSIQTGVDGASLRT